MERKYSDQGIIDCFRQIMDRSMAPGLAVYLYHIPQVTGVPLSQQVIRSLFQAYPQHILGIKDSQCDQAHSLALAAAFMKDLSTASEQDAGAIMLWLDGYLSGVSGDTTMRPDAMGKFAEKLIDRCSKNPDLKLLDAAKQAGHPLQCVSEPIE